MTLEELKTHLVNKEGWAITSESDKEVTFKRKRRKVDWSIFFLLLILFGAGIPYLIYCLFFKAYDEEMHRLKLSGEENIIDKIDLERIMKYKSVGEWFEGEKKAGYSIPLPLCRGIEDFMNKKRMPINHAFSFLVANKKLMLRDKMYIYDLSADHL